MTVIEVYAPTLDSSEKEKDSFYEDHISTIDAEREYFTIVMGDFNPKISKMNLNNTKHVTVGPYKWEKGGEMSICKQTI